MKAKLFLFSLIASFMLLGACKDDDDNQSLSGTKWVYSETLIPIESVLHFTSDKDVTLIMNIMGEADGGSATYIYNPPKVTFISDGESMTGTINGNKLTLTDPESGVSLVYNKQ